MSTVICPKCGKSLTVNSDDGDMIFCEYCGTKVNINVNFNFNYNYSKSEHTERIIDDAKIKAAENVNRVIGVFASPFEERRKAKEEQKRKEEEEARKREEAQREAQERARIRNARVAAFCKAHPKELLITIMASCIALIAGVSLWNVSNAHQAELAAHQAELARLEEEKIANSHLAMGEVKMPDFSKTGDYRNVVKALKDAGFTNVYAEGKGDMILGIFETENYIDEITVDGAPDFETNTWYKIDTPIVITYHSFYKSDVSSTKSASVISSSNDLDDTDEFCYANDEGNYLWCVWVIPSENIVRQFAYYGNGIAVSMTGRIVSGSASDGYTVHFEFSDGDTTGWDQTITRASKGLTVKYDDGSKKTFPDAYSISSVREIFDDSNSTWIEVPEGKNPSEYVDEYIAEHSASSVAASSTNASVLSTDGLDRAVTYEMAYTLDHGSYSTCYYIDFPNDKVYYFSYGNGDETAMVAHITSGTYEKGIALHYNYAPGWDEAMSFSDDSMVLTDAYGTRYTYSEADSSEIKRILNGRTIISED